MLQWLVSGAGLMVRFQGGWRDELSFYSVSSDGPFMNVLEF
jgi:hypothetical protein